MDDNTILFCFILKSRRAFLLALALLASRESPAPGCQPSACLLSAVFLWPGADFSPQFWGVSALVSTLT